MSKYTEQAEGFLRDAKTNINIVYTGKRKHSTDDEEKRDCYSVTLSNSKGEYEFSFGDSIENTQNRDSPKLYKPGYRKENQHQKVTAYDVISCLTKNPPGDFEDFCSDYGYDNDSKAAEKVYKAGVAEYRGLKAIFSMEELELMSEIY